MTATVIFVFLLVLIVVTLFAGVKTVAQGQIRTVERFGAFTRTLSPGLNFVVPFIDRIGHKMNVQEQVAAAPNTRLVVVPMESAGLAGGIVQAMQLVREGDKTAPDARA